MVPDNVEEEGLFEAARVSPTNFGLLLNARQAATTFGYLTVPEFVELTENSFQTYEKLEKYRGHIYNSYRHATLQPNPHRLRISPIGSRQPGFVLLHGLVRLLQRLLRRGTVSRRADHSVLLDGAPALAGLKHSHAGGRCFDPMPGWLGARSCRCSGSSYSDGRDSMVAGGDPSPPQRPWSKIVAQLHAMAHAPFAPASWLCPVPQDSLSRSDRPGTDASCSPPIWIRAGAGVCGFSSDATLLALADDLTRH